MMLCVVMMLVVCDLSYNVNITFSSQIKLVKNMHNPAQEVTGICLMCNVLYLFLG